MAVLLALVVVGGVVVRVWPFVRFGGARHYPVDNDEGVYFAAASMLVRGVLPYRDFALAHPPGILLAFAPAALAAPTDPAAAYALARWGSALVGALNLVLVWRIAARWSGQEAGLAAAALYAIYPEAALAERSTAIEPVLNLACLAMADAWLRPEPRAFRAGVFAGLALAVKLWAAPWILAVLLSLPREHRRVAVGRFALGGALATGVVALPFVAAAPGACFEQVLRLHSRRPPDGALGWTRVGELWNTGHGAATALAALALAVSLAPVVRGRREVRLFGSTYVLVALAFLAAPGFWRQYNSHLAAPECVLAGVAAAWLASRAGGKVGALTSRRRPYACAALVACALAALVPSLRACRASARLRAHDQDALGLAIRALPADARVFAFEPGWGLVAGRLPEVVPGREVVVDPWSRMMLEVSRGDRRFTDADRAWHESEAWRAIAPSLLASDYVVCGWRGAWQLGEPGRAWFEARFVQVWERPGPPALDLWRRR